MGSSTTTMMGVFLIILSLSTLPTTLASLYEVCGDTGLWSPNANIVSWLTTLPILHVGDQLHFTFASPTTVVMVNALGFLTCDASLPILKDVSGSFTITLTHIGLFSFISDGAGQCDAGLKLQVSVL